MDMSIATSLVAAKSANTQHSMQIAITKKSHEMQTDLISMLMQTAQAALPEGQGTQVNKTA